MGFGQRPAEDGTRQTTVAGSSAILVVDDDEDGVGALSELLTHAGFRVAHAENGAAGLRYLRTHEPPAMILLDWHMPIMSGNEMMQALQAEPRWRRIPVVLITADPDAKSRAVEMRAVGYIKKPFVEFDLLTMVGETLGHPS